MFLIRNLFVWIVLFFGIFFFQNIASAQFYSANGFECKDGGGKVLCQGRLCHDWIIFNPLYHNEFFCRSDIDDFSMTYDPSTGCLCQVEKVENTKDYSWLCRFRDEKTVNRFSQNGKSDIGPSDYSKEEFCKTGKIPKPKDNLYRTFQNLWPGFFQSSLTRRDELIKKNQKDYREKSKRETELFNKLLNEELKKKGLEGQNN